MAKKITYKYCSVCELNPTPSFLTVILPWSEKNEEIAKKEAYNGEYKIYDDGLPEPKPTEPSTDTDSIWDELEAAYQEGVDSV